MTPLEIVLSRLKYILIYCKKFSLISKKSLNFIELRIQKMIFAFDIKITYVNEIS